MLTVLNKRLLELQIPKFLLLLIVIGFLIWIGLIYQNHALWIHFVDEEDNILLGHFMLGGEKLYHQLFSQHQPLTYYLSSLTQIVFTPESMFLLVKRHREFIIFWSTFWSILLTLRFGFTILPFIFIYELGKRYLFGNLFLAESLVVHPLVYLFAFNLLPPKKTKIIELIILGILISVCQFLLAPMWPVLILLGVLVIKNNLYKKSILFFLSGYFITTVIILWPVNFFEYFHDAIFINFSYYIPFQKTDPFFVNLAKAFLTPFTSVFSWNTSAIGRINQFVSVGFLVGITLLLLKKQALNALILILLITFFNYRYINPHQEIYSGFHILPWFGSISASLGIIASLITKRHKKILFSFIALLIIITFSVLFVSKEWYLQKRDPILDYYINYSKQYDIGTIIKILKNPEDKLFVIPDLSLIYWHSDIAHANRLTQYYPFYALTPELSNSVNQMFKADKPTFLYMDCKVGCYGIENYKNEYRQIFKSGTNTNLYVKPERLKNLKYQQKKDLEFHNVTW